ncbi:hypothetical protein [Winogradskyella endarachnes]|uniref:Uncharacterized protein n=1 Tax=Winogradskyella endarachnes TaxID=2681965 RepID=A0A6L6UC07_9FLAO|nr:hypothetical protein [Winogradskyella endarachnes]MUU79881.1 hypothetical protein [Winogradskyella endarachnes]
MNCKNLIFGLLIGIIFSCSSQRNLNTTNPEYLKTGWYFVNDGGSGIIKKLDNSNKKISVNPKPIVTVENIEKLSIYETESGEFGMYIVLDELGLEKMNSASKKALNGNSYLGLIIDNKLIYMPKVVGEIEDKYTALNRGNISERRLKKLKEKIETEINKL